jgi:hypothetical protein
VEAPGIEPDQSSSRISTRIADPASTRLDFDSIEPASFHLDRPFGTTSRDIRATSRGASVRPLESSWAIILAVGLLHLSSGMCFRAIDAANATTACRWAGVSVGKARRMSISPAPSAKLATTLRTGTRVPRNTVAPPATVSLCSNCSSNPAMQSVYHEHALLPAQPASRTRLHGRPLAGGTPRRSREASGMRWGRCTSHRSRQSCRARNAENCARARPFETSHSPSITQ